MRLARLADVAPVQDQPVVRVACGIPAARPSSILSSTGAHRLARRKAGAVGDAEDVRIDRDRLRAERRVQDDIRGLAADAGQRLERLARSRHLAAVLLDQRAARRDDVFRLRVVEADRRDVALESFLAEIERSPAACARPETASASPC